MNLSGKEVWWGKIPGKPKRELHCVSRGRSPNPSFFHEASPRPASRARVQVAFRREVGPRRRVGGL